MPDGAGTTEQCRMGAMASITTGLQQRLLYCVCFLPVCPEPALAACLRVAPRLEHLRGHRVGRGLRPQRTLDYVLVLYGSIETTIERDKKGGFGVLPLPLIVLCGGFP